MSVKIYSVITNTAAVPATCLADGDSRRKSINDAVTGTPLSLRGRQFTMTQVYWKFVPYKLFGTLLVGSSINNNGFRLIFQFPKWLAQTAYELEYKVARSSLRQVTTRHYNIRPNDSPIFKCLRMGDFPGMLHIFKHRRASPFDRDQDGQSLLHVSVPPRLLY